MKTPPPLPLRAESEALAIGRERRLRVIVSRILGQIDRILSTHALEIDVPLPRGPALIDERLPVRRKARVQLRSRLVGELGECRRSGARRRTREEPRDGSDGGDEERECSGAGHNEPRRNYAPAPW